MLENAKLDANGNVNNLNDYMAKNTLIGSNLYISPMNNTGLYVPSQSNQAQQAQQIQRQYKFKPSKRKINSSFSPSVDL